MDYAPLFDLIGRAISQLGFPIFIAVWLLIRTDRLLSTLNTTLNMMQLTMQALQSEIAAAHQNLGVRPADTRSRVTD